MNKALVLIDVQNYFFDKKNLHPPRCDVITEMSRSLDFFRAKNIKVIHVQTRVDKNLSNKMPHWNNQLAKLFQDKKKTFNPPIILKPIKNELVFFKSFYSGFEDPLLHKTLKDALIDELFIIGLYTHACIRQTAIDAYQKKYKVTIIDNAIASDDPVHADITKNYLSQRGIYFSHFDTVKHNLSREFNLLKHKKHFYEHRSPLNPDVVISKVPFMDQTTVKKIIEPLKKYQIKWSEIGPKNRLTAINSFYKHLLANKKVIIDCIMKDVAKTKVLAEEEFNFAKKLALYSLRKGTSFSIKESLVPHGVVAVITPWNNPLALAVGKILPALLHGNTVAWKPAPQTPLTSNILLKLFKKTPCAQAVDMISGGRDSGRFLIESEVINSVTFTGSEVAGREIAMQCARQFKPFQGELGGNNALLIFTKTHIRKYIKAIAYSTYAFSGQRCTAIRRIIVHKKIKKLFLELFIQEIKYLQNSFEYPHGMLSPIISLDKRNSLIRAINNEVENGAQLIVGGRIPKNKSIGSWMEPTLLDHVNTGSEIAQLESFGPIAILFEAQSIEEGMQIANSTRYGLLTVLLSDSKKDIAYFKKEARTGIISINQCPLVIDPKLGFLGWKASGYGLAEHGIWDKLFYSRIQSIYHQ